MSRKSAERRIAKREASWQAEFRRDAERGVSSQAEQITMVITGGQGDMVYGPVTTTSQRFEYAVAWFQRRGYRLESHQQGIGLHPWTLVFAREVPRATVQTNDVADQLGKLSALTKDGILTEDEWDRAKSLFLGKPTSRMDEDVRMLRNLHELHRSGVLTEGEFNLKKWDILSRS